MRKITQASLYLYASRSKKPAIYLYLSLQFARWIYVFIPAGLWLGVAQCGIALDLQYVHH